MRKTLANRKWYKASILNPNLKSFTLFTTNSKTGMAELESSLSWPQPGLEFILLLLGKRPPRGPQ